MHRLLLIFLLVFSIQLPSPAQPLRTRIDSLTWDLYSSKRWEPLLRETRESLHNGIDFYYLRVRAGVAAYELKKYKLAVTHFRKAFEASKKDDFLNSYFYWALILSGREDEATGLTDSFQDRLLKEMNVKKTGVLSSIASESLLSVNRNFNGLSGEKLGQSDGNSLFRSLLKYQFYQGVALDLHPGARLNLYNHFCMMDIRRAIQVNNKVNLPENFKEPGARQYQYYLAGRFFPLSGWDVSASFTKLWGMTDYYIPSSMSSGNIDLSLSTWDIKDFVVTAGLEKDWTYLKPGFELGYAEINRLRQWQGTLSLALYPFGNLDFYLAPEVSIHREEGAVQTELILHPLIGLKTGPLWLTGEYSFGKMKNYFLRGGQVVYNMPETINGQWGLTLWTPLFKNRLALSMKYMQSEKEGTTFVYADAVNYDTKLFYFTDFNFLISLRWRL